MSKPALTLFRLRAIPTWKKVVTVLVALIIVILIILLVKFLAFPTKKAAKGAVVTNGEACAAIGTSILEKGGSAADAAIAALFCEGIALSHSMGLGGGFLLTIYDSATGTVESLNAREMAPLAATEDMYQGNSTLSQTGGLAVAVPGELRGYWYLYQKYGKLPWKELVQPTIDLCKSGVYMTSYLANVHLGKKEELYNDPVLRDIFIDPTTNSTYLEGQYVKRLRLAKTLEIIAEEGGDALHNGSLTAQFVKDIQDNNGIITVEDMNTYTPEWQESIRAEFVTNEIMYTAPLPGSGVVLTFILNILDQFLNLDDYFTVQTHQRIIESYKFGYGMRTNLGDEKFVNIGNLLANLTSKSYAEEIRRLIFDNSTSQDPLYYGANTSLIEDHGTAHLAVLSANGDAVSVTSTINLVFGAKFASNSTGIILNNEMDDFSSPSIANNSFDLPASPANYIVPRKRPLSSMVPTIILKDNKVVLLTGAAGGSKITTVVAQVLDISEKWYALQAILCHPIIIKHLWYKRDLQDAIDDIRFHHQLFPMKINFEEGFNDTYPEIFKGLIDIGHDYYFTETSSGFSALTSISAVDSITCGYDWRRSGAASYIY